MIKDIVLIIHDVRSAHNVGSLLRSADGFGLKKVYCTGYTPYPKLKNDQRFPHESAKITKQIAKTSLGAEKFLQVVHESDIDILISCLGEDGYTILALEQAAQALPISQAPEEKQMVLIVGNEIEGLSSEVLNKCDAVLEIPMKGSKESFNVAVAGAIGLYELTSGPS